MAACCGAEGPPGAGAAFVGTWYIARVEGAPRRPPLARRRGPRAGAEEDGLPACPSPRASAEGAPVLVEPVAAAGFQALLEDVGLPSLIAALVSYMSTGGINCYITVQDGKLQARVRRPGARRGFCRRWPWTA